MGWVDAIRRWFAGAGGRQSPRAPSRAENELLHLCRGDAEKVERLIDYEHTQQPSLSRAAASRAAVERWARDR